MNVIIDTKNGFNSFWLIHL